LAGNPKISASFTKFPVFFPVPQELVGLAMLFRGSLRLILLWLMRAALIGGSGWHGAS
jgi:hypothetical protein